jgi:LysR family hydrogen peroxide-inducible transcriptional activator
MDVRQLRQVMAIGRNGSFSKAAKDLGIAQPTLSKGIARLEDELGVRLFDRSGWSAKMTPIGEFIARQAETILNEAHQLDRNVQLFARGELGDLKIGLGPALRTTFMPRLAAMVLTRHPHLRLTIRTASSIELRHAMHSGDLDMIILADTAIAQEQNLVIVEVMVEPNSRLMI